MRILDIMFLVVAGLLIAADQITKIWAVNTFALNGPGYPLGLGFHFTYIRNTGAAFGILQGRTLGLGILSAIVSVFLVGYLLRNGKSLSRLHYTALTLILGGAVGNMIDRFRLNYVIDFIHFYLPNFNFPVFNLADSFVVIGAGLLMLSSFLEPKPVSELTDQSQPHPPHPDDSPRQMNVNHKLTDPDFFRHMESDSVEHQS
ncbi:MAG: signal peptidase II [Deinococcota bacterium]